MANVAEHSSRKSGLHILLYDPGFLFSSDVVLYKGKLRNSDTTVAKRTVPFGISCPP